MLHILASMRHVDNRRRVFEEIAKSRGLDPLVADSWLKISSAEIRNIEVSCILLIILNE